MRPRVSVIIPFSGKREQACRLTARLESMRRRSTDEVIVVDNSRQPVVSGVDGSERLTVVRATGEPSSYYARNVGAQVATGEWLLFIDADCAPAPSLLDAYFDPPPSPGSGAVAGTIAAAGPARLLGRWARAREVLDQGKGLSEDFPPYAFTANLLVRRAAFDDVTGFVERVRSGGDVDFCWRLQDGGWGLEQRPGAWVAHHHRETVGQLLDQAKRYGRAAAWVERRYPGWRPSSVRERIWREASAFASHLLQGSFERAVFHLVDFVFYAAWRWGHPQSNSVTTASLPKRGRVICATEFPTTAIGPEVVRGDVRVEAVWRSARPRAAELRGLPVTYLEDDSFARRLLSAVLLAILNPIRLGRFWLGDRFRDRDRGAGLLILAPAARRARRLRDRLSAAEPGALRLTEDLGTLSGRPVAKEAPPPSDENRMPPAVKSPDAA